MSESKQQFDYRATNDTNEVVTGRITAENVLDAAEKLKQRGLTVFSIQPAASSDSSTNGASRSEPISNDNTVANAKTTVGLESCLESIIRQRESLIPAMTAVQQELPTGPTRREIQQLVHDLRSATSARNLAESKMVVRWMPLLMSGTGSPERIGDLISRATSELSRMQNRRRLFAYPLVIGAVGLAMVLLLAIFLLPSFAAMYDDFGLRLPMLTRWILGLSHLVLNRPLQLLISTALVIGLIYVFVRLWTHYALTSRLLGFFVPGDSSSLLAMSSLTGQLAELVDANVTLHDALWIAGQGCRHYRYRKIAERLAQEVRQPGLSVRHCANARYLPANVVDALDTSPTPNARLLRQLSAMYADRVDQRTDWAHGVVQPLTIMIVGILMGSIVTGLFMPMVDLITGLS